MALEKIYHPLYVKSPKEIQNERIISPHNKSCIWQAYRHIIFMGELRISTNMNSRRVSTQLDSIEH